MNQGSADNRNSHTFIDEMIYFPGGSIFAAVSRSYDDTIGIARIFASILTSGDVVCMDGDLGAGKTAFASGIASGLGIEGVVPSPTFTILHEYSIRGTVSTAGTTVITEGMAAPDMNPPDCRNQNPPVSAFYHFDVYRLSGEEDFYSMGFDEYLGCEGSVCVIEWAEKVRGVLPPSVIQILLFRPEITQEPSETSETPEAPEVPEAGEYSWINGESGGHQDEVEMGGRMQDKAGMTGRLQDEAGTADELRQERKILFYFPEGDTRADTLRRALQELNYRID